MSGAYEAAYQASILRPESFWAEAAEGIEWTRRWDEVLDRTPLPPRAGSPAQASTPATTPWTATSLAGRGGASRRSSTTAR